MKLLFIADPLERLSPAGDSSLAMARAALRRRHQVHWAVPEDLSYALDRVKVLARPLTAGPGDLPAAGKPGDFAVRDFQGVFIRKDPPFDTGYVRLCWFLSLEEERVPMINRPSLLLRYHEKLLPLEGLAQGFLEPSDLIPTFIGGREEALAYFESRKIDQVVTKPFLGYGGHHVMLQDRKFRADADSFIQPYAAEVTRTGDRRVLYLEGKVLGHFARMPAPGGFVSNLAQGGTAHKVPLTPAEQKLADKVGKMLGALDLPFAGADFIGPHVSEINITSPTGLRSLEKLEGSDGADAIIEAWEKRAKHT